ncbi:MAG: MarR family transcriptional regulator [Candidatus Omnitrophica bacterium]|nr:MarR family transcriptional regulator [Candidatus Omnitrophota bacterium]
MVNLSQYGIIRGEGRYYQEIVYTTALVYNLASQKIEEYLSGYNLTLGKLNILIALKYHGKEEGLSQVELSQHLILTPSNMTKMIDKLEKEGLVTRSAMVGDRRVNIVKVTAKAGKLLDNLWEGFQATMVDLVKKLEPAQQKQLAERLIEWSEKLLE